MCLEKSQILHKNSGHWYKLVGGQTKRRASVGVNVKTHYNTARALSQTIIKKPTFIIVLMVWDNVSVKMAIGGKCASPFLSLLVLFAFWQRARAALFCRAFWLLLSDCKSNEEESYFLK